MSRSLLFLFFWCCAFSATAAVPASAPPPQLPIEDFFRDPEFQSARLSPDGTHLAMTVPRGDRTVMTVLRIADRSVIGTWDYGRERHIQDVVWVNPGRLMFRVGIKTGRFDFQVGASDLYASNIDGSRRIDIPNGAFFDLVHLNPADPDSVIVQRTIDQPFLYRLNVNTGRTTTIASAPLVGGGFLLDHDMKVRYAIGTDKDLGVLTLQRDGDGWKTLHRAPDGEATLQPMMFADDGRRVYFQVSEDGKPEQTVLIDPATQAREPLSANPRVSPAGALISSDGRTLLALRYDDGRAQYDFVAPGHPETAVYRGLVAAFPDHDVEFLDASADGRLVLLRAYSDRDPGQSYLFDRQTGKATFLFAGMDWIKPEQMAPVRPISLRARDGLMLHGYLTLPAGRPERALPLVVNVHGGPHGVRDRWEFSPESQLLANRGYAVLQLNFRGSGGYGNAFQLAGYRQWGGTMQDDLTDAVAWAVGEGIADPRRICIYGGSYGGYAALMSPIREPTLYRCAVGYVGIYSLPMMFERGDVSERDTGQVFQRRILPEDRAQQIAWSPAYHADKLQLPVMLVHGAQDARVPVQQMEFLVKQMQAAGRAPEDVLVAPREGHGFRDLENNVQLYTRLLAFLDRHIGAEASAP
jgi:dipeptidyl aminopeptidase/acylaminoacyl peptidase